MSSSSAKSQSAPQVPSVPTVPTAAPVVPATLDDDSWGDIFADAPTPSAPAPSVPAPSVPSLAPAVSAPVSDVPEVGVPRPVAITRTPEPTAVISNSPSVSLKPAAPFRLWANREGSGPKAEADVPFFAPPGETATELRPPEVSEPEARVEPADTEEEPAPEVQDAGEATPDDAPLEPSPAESESRPLGHGHSDPAAVTQPITLSESASGEIETDETSEVKEPVAEESSKSERPIASVGPSVEPSRPRPAPMTAFSEPAEKRRLPVVGIGVALALAGAVFLAMPGQADNAPVVENRPAQAAEPKMEEPVVEPKVAGPEPVDPPPPVEAEPPAEPEVDVASEAEEAMPTEGEEPAPAEPEAEAEVPTDAPVEGANDADTPAPDAPAAEVAPKPGVDARESADAKLEAAKLALDEGRYREAHSLAKESNAIKTSLATRKLLVVIACHRKRVSEAKAGLAKLPPATAARVLEECERRGVQLGEDSSAAKAPAKMEEPGAVDTSAPPKAEPASPEPTKPEKPALYEPPSEG